ncbi:MAG TPA: serine hydrolase domain-containing protein [Thermoanaerobaculia bacterium]|nr:serine hydrolase domain-containing protein [Thermoanaerobaculia bacterium]
MRGQGADRLARTVAAIEESRGRGLHLGAQLAVWRGEELIADLALGEDRPGRALERDDLMLWLSTTKPVTAVALGQLWERGLLALDDPIARHLPEFAQGGKESITLRHALTHTGGFRMLNVGWPEASWEEIVAKICAARREPRWEPGRKAGYHDSPSWFVLGEVVARLSGRPFEAYVRDEIFLPLGMADCWIGMPAERYRAYGERVAAAWDTAGPEAKRFGWDSEVACVNPSPAGGGRGPMHQLVTFYRMLLGGGQLDGVRLLTPQTVEALVARHRVGMLDHTFRHVMDWGLGFIPDSKQYGVGVPYAYGRHCSPRTFGHSGYRSSTAFGDAEHGLAVALAFNGLPGDAAHAPRMRGTLEAIYEDLGLAGES